MTNFNERTNTLLYKNIISHTLFSKGWWLLCVRDKLETRTDCCIDPVVLLSHLGWVVQPWVTEGPKAFVCHWLSIRHLVSNWLFFQIPKFSAHRFWALRHSYSRSISYLGFIMTVVIVISSASEHKLYPMSVHLN